MGRVRRINQDNFYVQGRYLAEPQKKRTAFSLECDGGLFAVADGMGGETDGEKASFIAVSELSALGGEKYPSPKDIDLAAARANEKVCEMVRKTGSSSGTTLAAAVIKGSRLSVCNIGDSKCLLYRRGRLTRLTKDHTVTAQMIEAGLMTEEEAARDRRSHQLFQHIGMPSDEMRISLYHRDGIVMEPDDILVICSDGMTDGLSPKEAVSVIGSVEDRTALAAALADAAIENGSSDNVTVITVSRQPQKRSALKAFLIVLACLGIAAAGTVGALFAAGILKL